MRLFRFIFTVSIRNQSSILGQQRVTKLLFGGSGSSSSLFLPFSTLGSSSVFAVNSRSSIDSRKSNLSVVEEVHSGAFSSSVSGSSSQGFFLDMKPHSLSRRVEGEPLFVSQVIQGAMEIPDFYIYNSMTKQKEVFKPKEPGVAKMYVCGITSYDFSHVGHGRANVSFDILYRYLQYLGYKVTYVRNFTDVDDKIIQRANKEGVDPLVLSNRFCQEFLDDMNDLHCLPPTHQPRVSDHIDQIIDMINKIITNGCAYTVDGDVYYCVDKFSNYGCLSRRKVEDNKAGERVAVDSRKQNPADFALWKAAKPGEPSWKSPWGHGRPGWHIECSAMSAHYLTPSFDIHGGGIDLIFPHHENEIAQSWAACSEANVTYWAHNGHMTCNDVKMSKSLGNHESIRKVTGIYHPLALRYFFLCAHYRSSINYSTSQLDIASDAIFYIYQTLHDCRESLSSFDHNLPGGKSANAPKAKVTSEAQEYIDKLLSDFKEKMSDDLHIPGFLNSTFQEALRFLNTSLNKLKKSKQNVASLLLSIASLEDVVKEVLDTIGLLPSSYAEVLDDLRNKALKMAGLTEDDIKSAIEERARARNDKDYKRSDQIRSDLVNKGIDLMDVGKETIWRPRFGH